MPNIFKEALRRHQKTLAQHDERSYEEITAAGLDEWEKKYEQALHDLQMAFKEITPVFNAARESGIKVSASETDSIGFTRHPGDQIAPFETSDFLSKRYVPYGPHTLRTESNMADFPSDDIVAYYRASSWRISHECGINELFKIVPVARAYPQKNQFPFQPYSGEFAVCRGLYVLDKTYTFHISNTAAARNNIEKQILDLIKRTEKRR